MSERQPTTSATEHEQPSRDDVINEFQGKRSDIQAQIDEVQARPGFKLDAIGIMNKRRESNELRDKLATATDAWNELGGEAIDKAQQAVGGLNFKSNATDHISAKNQLRDAKNTFYENFTAPQESIETEEVEDSTVEADAAIFRNASTDEKKKIFDAAYGAGSGEMVTLDQEGYENDEVLEKLVAAAQKNGYTVPTEEAQTPQLVNEKTELSITEEVKNRLTPEQKRKRLDDMVPLWKNASNDERQRMLKTAYGEEEYKKINQDKVDKLSDEGISAIVDEAYDNGYRMPGHEDSTGTLEIDSEDKKSPVAERKFTAPSSFDDTTGEMKVPGEESEQSADLDDSDFDPKIITSPKGRVRKFGDRIKEKFSGMSRKEKLAYGLGAAGLIIASVAAYRIFGDHSVVSGFSADVPAVPTTDGAGEAAKQTVEAARDAVPGVGYGEGLINLAKNEFGITEQQYYAWNLGEQALKVAPDFVQRHGSDIWVTKPVEHIPESINRLFALSSLRR